jgi:uncharacterized membrane protein
MTFSARADASGPGAGLPPPEGAASPVGEPRTAATYQRDLTALVRCLAALSMIGLSVALGIGQACNPHLAAFISDNTSSASRRNMLLIEMVLGVTGALLTATILHWLQPRAAGLQRLSRATHLLAPLGLTAFLPSLLLGDAWRDPLKLVIAMGVFVLAAEPLLRMHFSAYRLAPSSSPVVVDERTTPPWFRNWSWFTSSPGATSPRRMSSLRWAGALRRHGAPLTVLAMALFYIGYMSFYVIRNHHRFNSYTWDLGQLDNQFYNFLHGHPFRCTALIREGNWSELRNHAEATVFFLLPFYALWPSAETLLVLQAVLLGGAGIFVYRFAARRIHRSMAVVLTATYYLYPPLHGAQFFDIHFQLVAAALLLAAIDCFDLHRMRLFVVFFILAIGCREDISVGTAVFGLFLILTGHRPRAGLVILLVSMAYFVALRFFVMPAIGPWGFAEHYRLLFPEGQRSFAGILKTIVSNPVFTFTTLLTAEKLRYALQLLVPLAFLPLRRLHLAMSILPGAYFTFLTTEYPPTLNIGYQYSGYFLPYFFPAVALALAAIGRQKAGPAAVARQRAAVAALVVGTILTTVQWGAIPPRREFHSAYGVIDFDPPTAQQVAWGKGIRELDRMVPRDAILAVTDREMPHVSNRLECWNLSVGFQGADYILYTSDHPIQPEREMFQAAQQAGYKIVATRPGLILLKRPGAR